MSDKNIRDYLHFYLGCECLYYPKGLKYLPQRGRLLAMDLFEEKAELRDNAGNAINRPLLTKPQTPYLKPLLRLLSSITDEEKRELLRINDDFGGNNILSFFKLNRNVNFYFNSANPFIVQYLLSKGFDLFGLIDAGLALDKSKQP
jgi:hypothetical protein